MCVCVGGRTCDGVRGKVCLCMGGNLWRGEGQSVIVCGKEN